MRTLTGQQDTRRDRGEVTTTALDALLEDVAVANLDDPAWDVLRRRARTLTRALAGLGAAPAGVVVEASDPPVAVARALAVAARHAAEAARRGYIDRRGPVAC